MPGPSKRGAYPPVELGLLPVNAINRALATELEPGRVYLSGQAHWHIATDHPDDYAIVMRVLRQAIERPTFVGQAPHHAANFELVRRLREDGAILVAIGLEPDGRGFYRIKSSYLIDRDEVSGAAPRAA